MKRVLVLGSLVLAASLSAAVSALQLPPTPTPTVKVSSLTSSMTASM